MTDLYNEILTIVYKHLPGQHDQKTHGKRASGEAIDVGSKLNRHEVINHIMTTNPPEQVKSGKMTPEKWAEEYLSNDGEYTAMEVDPRAVYLPAETITKKVGDYSKMSGLNSPAIVIDSNKKIEARFGGGKLDRAYGRQPDTVIDGKHRVEAAISRGDKSIMAIVPSNKVNDLLIRSHSFELRDFATDYFDGKNYKVLKFDGINYLVDRNGIEQVYTPRDLTRIAKNTGHSWKYDKSGE